MDAVRTTPLNPFRDDFNITNYHHGPHSNTGSLVELDAHSRKTDAGDAYQSDGSKDVHRAPRNPMASRQQEPASSRSPAP